MYKKIIYTSLIAIILLVINCCTERKVKNKNTLELLEKLTIRWITPDGEWHESTFAENNSTFYFSEIHKILYREKKKYYLSDTLSDFDIINKYSLKKINKKMFIDEKNKYQNHFKYIDCFTSIETKLDTGVVSTLKSKSGNIYQYIDEKNQPMILQICTKKQKYKFHIINITEIESQFLGFGDSHALLYDIDKDGKEEFVIVYNNVASTCMAVYKINNIEP